MKSKFKFVAVLTLTGILFLFSCSETQDGSDNTLFTLLSLLGEKTNPLVQVFIMVNSPMKTHPMWKQAVKIYYRLAQRIYFLHRHIMEV